MLKSFFRNILFNRAWSKYRSLQPRMVYGVKFGGKKLPLTRISSSSVVNSPDKLELDDNVFIGHFNFIEASNGIEIKKGTQITNYISILSHSSHISIRLYRENYRDQKNPIGYKKGRVKIGEYCFIGPHCTIMPGTTLGKGCLVQSHSLVKGDFPDFSIIGGRPAAVVGDTRKLDEKFLEENDLLKKNYEAWVENVD